MAQVSIDGNLYPFKWDSYKKSPINYSTVRPTLSGTINKNQAPFTHYRFNMSLLLTPTQYTTIFASFNKKSPNNLIAFTDRDGTAYIVYFSQTEISPKPLSPTITGTSIKWTCDIELYGKLP